MGFGKNLKNALTGDTTIQAAISGRVYPILAPAGVESYPYIVYSSELTAADGTKDGQEAVRNASVTIVGRYYEDVEDLAENVRDCVLYGENDLPDSREFLKQKETYIESIDSYAIDIEFEFNENI